MQKIQSNKEAFNNNLQNRKQLFFLLEKRNKLIIERIFKGKKPQNEFESTKH